MFLIQPVFQPHNMRGGGLLVDGGFLKEGFENMQLPVRRITFGLEPGDPVSELCNLMPVPTPGTLELIANSIQFSRQRPVFFHDSRQLALQPPGPRQGKLIYGMQDFLPVVFHVTQLPGLPYRRFSGIRSVY